MEGKIIVHKANDRINFYWINRSLGKCYLFSQKFSKGVFEFFRNGRSTGEIRNFKKWNVNSRLDKTITKLPMYMRYVQKEYAA